MAIACVCVYQHNPLHARTLNSRETRSLHFNPREEIDCELLLPSHELHCGTEIEICRSIGKCKCFQFFHASTALIGRLKRCTSIVRYPETTNVRLMCAGWRNCTSCNVDRQPFFHSSVPLFSGICASIHGAGTDKRHRDCV